MDYALVTGASGGLGEHYARYLARQGHNLILSARSGDKLETLAAELRGIHQIEAVAVPADLGTAEGRATLLARTAELGEVTVLVNNAGFGTAGDFVDQDADRQLQELELNCVTLTALSRAFTPAMVERGEGTVINVASVAAYQPIPGMAVYAASKAYVLSLSQAMWAELNPKGVRVIAVCPGPTATEFFTRAGAESMMGGRRTTEQVVQSTFKALNRGAASVIDGAVNTVMGQLSKRLPVQLVLPIARRYARGH